MHKIESMQTGGKKYWNILLCWPRFEPRASGVVLQGPVVQKPVNLT